MFGVGDSGQWSWSAAASVGVDEIDDPFVFVLCRFCLCLCIWPCTVAWLNGSFFKVDPRWFWAMRWSGFFLLLVSMCVWWGRNMLHVGSLQDPGVSILYEWSPLTYDWLIAAWPLDIFFQTNFCPDVVGCWWIACIVLPLCWKLSLYMVQCVTLVFCSYA